MLTTILKLKCFSGKSRNFAFACLGKCLKHNLNFRKKQVGRCSEAIVKQLLSCLLSFWSGDFCQQVVVAVGESVSISEVSLQLQVPSPGTYIVKMTEDVGKTANKMTLSSAAMMGELWMVANVSKVQKCVTLRVGWWFCSSCFTKKNTWWHRLTCETSFIAH